MIVSIAKDAGEFRLREFTRTVPGSDTLDLPLVLDVGDDLHHLLVARAIQATFDEPMIRFLVIVLRICQNCPARYSISERKDNPDSLMSALENYQQFSKGDRIGLLYGHSLPRVDAWFYFVDRLEAVERPGRIIG